MLFIGLIVAEREVRVRVRGRVVSVNVQRRQVRIVSVVAAAESAHKGTVQLPYCNLTSGGYSDSLAPFGRWPGFMDSAVAPLPCGPR